MQRARPEELMTRAIPALMAHVPASSLAKLFPVKMAEMDPFSEAEPSKGALVKLDSGRYVVVIYGKVTETLKVLVPEKSDATKEIEGLLHEVPLDSKSILWRCDEKRLKRIKLAAHRHGAATRKPRLKVAAASKRRRAPRRKR